MSNIPNRLKEIFGPITEISAQYKVHISATHFKDTTNIYIPTNPFDKLIPGMQLVKQAKLITKLKKDAEANEQNLDRSLRRSIQRCKHIIRCNDFDWFVTFTFAHDRYDVDKCRRRMETWLENRKKRDGHFEYVIVIEYHEDGAPHFHALLQGYTGKIVPSIHPRTGKQIKKKRRLVFDLPGYTHGFVYAYKCDTTQKDKQVLEYYLNKLEKYLNKEKAPLNGKKRFWYTRGLKKPVKEDNPTWYSDDMKPIWETENEWGVTKIFTNEQVEKAKRQLQ